MGSDFIEEHISYADVLGISPESVDRLDPADKDELYEKMRKITDKVYNRWLRKANDVLDFIVKTMPGAETMDMDLVQKRIQGRRGRHPGTRRIVGNLARGGVQVGRWRGRGIDREGLGQKTPVHFLARWHPQGDARDFRAIVFKDHHEHQREARSMH